MTATANDAIGWRRAPSPGVLTRERDSVIDTMRGVAIVMVVAIHSLPKAAEGTALITAIDAALRPCVPIFLFASGYLTAPTQRVPMAKRVRRALGPYSIAFIAAYIFMALHNPVMDNRPLIIVARYGLAYVFVYYYVFVYIGCTVALWLVYTAAGSDERRLIFFLSLAIIFGLLVGAYLDPLLQHLGLRGSMIEEARMRDLPFWFGFVALGVIVGKTGAQNLLRDLRVPLVTAAAIAYAVYALIRIEDIGDAADYDSIAFFLYAALFCLAMLAFSFDWRSLAGLGAASYFIYLWHIFVIMLLRELPALQQHAVTAFVTEFAAALALSAALVAAIRWMDEPRLTQWLGA